MLFHFAVGVVALYGFIGAIFKQPAQPAPRVQVPSSAYEEPFFCQDSYTDRFEPRTAGFNSLAEFQRWLEEPMRVDPFLVYNRAWIALKENRLETGDGPEISILDDRGPDSAGRCFDGPPQGATDYPGESGAWRSVFPRWNFGQWPFIRNYIFFSHKMFSIPPAVWTNAAHKNGVRSLATLIFEHDTMDAWNEMVRDQGNVYSAGLALLAERYGFDGYFINIEADGQMEVEKTYEFLEKLKAQNLYVQWYDSVTTDGEVDYQNALTEKNKPFFDKSSSIFTNYWWEKKQIVDSAKLAGNRSGDVMAGIDGYARQILHRNHHGASRLQGGRTFRKTMISHLSRSEALGAASRNYPGEVASAMEMIWDKNEKRLMTSVGIFAPDWTFFNADPNNLLEDFLLKEAQMWLSAGVGHFVKPNSPITELPFVTNFNTGQGKNYYRFGERQSRKNWNHLSQQDIPLTYKHDPALYKGDMFVKETYDIAYHGGSSLGLYGSTQSPQVIDLFATRLKISKPSELRLMVSPGEQPMKADVFVVLQSKKKGEVQYFISHPLEEKKEESQTWEQYAFSLDQLIGDEIERISLKIVPKRGEFSPSAPNDALMYFGELVIADREGLAKEVAPVVDLSTYENRDEISWAVPDECEYFEVFAFSRSKLKHYLGRAYGVFYYYPKNLMGVDTTCAFSFDVVCVNKYGKRSSEKQQPLIPKNQRE